MELRINSIVDAKSTCGFHREWTNTWKRHPLRSVKQVKYKGIKKTSKLKITWVSIGWESIAFSCSVLTLSQVSTSGACIFAYFLQTRVDSYFCYLFTLWLCVSLGNNITCILGRAHSRGVVTFTKRLFRPSLGMACCATLVPFLSPDVSYPAGGYPSLDT